MEDIKKIVEDMEIRQASTNVDYSVVMANDMVKGCSNLSLNELKLLRTIIMQVKKEDTELYPYKISVKDFQKMTGCTSKNLYSLADKMTDHLLREIIRIGDGNPKHSWKKFQWVSMCSYEDGYFTIKLNDALKPYLIGLKKFYTEFKLEDIIRLNSVYSIRLLELIYEALKSAPVYADKVAEVYISLDVIRKATNTEGKYTSVNRWKERVINAAVKEINEKSNYYLTVREYKSSRKIEGFYFTVESQAGHNYRAGSGKQLTLQDWETESQIETVK